MSNSGKLLQPLLKMKDIHTTGSFDGIVCQIADCMCYMRENGCIDMPAFYVKNSGKYHLSAAVEPIIEKGVRLIVDGVDTELFDFEMDCDITNTIRRNPALGDLEIAQLYLARQMLVYLRNLNFEDFLVFANQFYSSTLRYDNPKMSDYAEKKTVTRYLHNKKLLDYNDYAELKATWTPATLPKVTVNFKNKSTSVPIINASLTWKSYSKTAADAGGAPDLGNKSEYYPYIAPLNTASVSATYSALYQVSAEAHFYANGIEFTLSGSINATEQ